jgi:hypothetical protein
MPKKCAEEVTFCALRCRVSYRETAELVETKEGRMPRSSENLPPDIAAIFDTPGVEWSPEACKRALLWLHEGPQVKRLQDTARTHLPRPHAVHATDIATQVVQGILSDRLTRSVNAMTLTLKRSKSNKCETVADSWILCFSHPRRSRPFSGSTYKRTRGSC